MDARELVEMWFEDLTVVNEGAIFNGLQIVALFQDIFGTFWLGVIESGDFTRLAKSRIRPEGIVQLRTAFAQGVLKKPGHYPFKRQGSNVYLQSIDVVPLGDVVKFSFTYMVHKSGDLVPEVFDFTYSLGKVETMCRALVNQEQRLSQRLS